MTSHDERPAVWVGHIQMATNTIDASRQFMVDLGMRPIARGDGFAVLELRAGTHLVLVQKDDLEPGRADFDLMVEDLDAVHASLGERGFEPSEIKEGRIHRSFTVQDPSGQVVTFNDSHNSEHPV